MPFCVWGGCLSVLQPQSTGQQIVSQLYPYPPSSLSPPSQVHAVALEWDALPGGEGGLSVSV